jgi:hypothetical protein
MFKAAMRFLVDIIMLCFAWAICYHVFLEVCLREKEAGAMGTFEVVFAVLLLSHRDALVDVKEYFFTVKF